ncbi:MAG: peroxiredoxin [Deltaproteobacteria bacterium]|nr:peroxiredoxin [Deltaproteobacteria bacterium]
MSVEPALELTVSPLPSVGAVAPSVAGPTGSGAISATELAGRPFVLYFYPKDATPGCTVEAHDFRDASAQFAVVGVRIIGVSRDSARSHARFCEKEGLTFPLIADESGVLCAAFGVWQEKKQYGRSYMGIVRSTFLIGADGRVAAVWSPVKVKGHVEAVLAAARALPAT